MNITLTLTKKEMVQVLSEFCGIYTSVLAAFIRAGEGIRHSHAVALQTCKFASSDPVAPNRGEVTEEVHHIRITYRSSNATEYVFRFAKEAEHENSFSFPKSTSLLKSFERIAKHSRKKQASVTPVKIRVPDTRGAAVAIERYLCGMPGMKDVQETTSLHDQKFLAVNSDGTIVGLSEEKFNESEAPEYEVSIGRIPKVLHMQEVKYFFKVFDFPNGIEKIEKKEELSRDEAGRVAKNDFVFIATKSKNGSEIIYRNGYYSDFVSLAAGKNAAVKPGKLPKGDRYYRVELTAKA